MVALHRSGHHAIVHWIEEQAGNVGCFLNDCSPRRNPYLTCAKDGYSSFKRVELSEQAAGRHTRKDFLLYNYESQELSAVADSVFDANREKWLGRSKTRQDLLVLRDAFNFFASIRKVRDDRSGLFIDERLGNWVRLWKAYAREFKSDSAMLPEKVTVSFNAWVSDREYRKALASKLGLEFTDAGRERVVAWGSSFDGKRFDGEASQMQVLKRWQGMAEDPLYRSLFRDRELVDLSNEIFGFIPGTEELGR